MPTRETPWPAGTPCWVDLSVPDMPRAAEFYSALLGWSVVDRGEEFGHYHIADVGGRPAAGMSPPMSADQPQAWTLYLATDDADATAKLITDNGGSLLFDPMDVPGQGRMTVAVDPTGGAFGIWQAAGMNGIGIYNEPGGLSWEDARLTDPAAGKAFYTAVFGYTYQPVPGAPDDYGTIHIGGDPIGGMGGMMGLPAGTPSHWVPYFAVADADVAADVVEQHGGRVLEAPFTTPYGRMSPVADPFGATFMVIAS